MKFAAIFFAVVAISTLASSISIPEPIEEIKESDRLTHPQCVWPQIWWTADPIGCSCWNRDEKPLCTWPGSWSDNQCHCKCPWFASWLCKSNQFLNPKTCKCECYEPCRDCSAPQTWINSQCSCGCPTIVSCPKNKFFNYWTCKCECRQEPRQCCPCLKPYKIWKNDICDCQCAFIQSCNTFAGFSWDPYICQCVKSWEVLWHYEIVDAAEAAKGVEPDEIDLRAIDSTS